jgi:hypothetical protein
MSIPILPATNALAQVIGYIFGGYALAFEGNARS